MSSYGSSACAALVGMLSGDSAALVVQIPRLAALARDDAPLARLGLDDSEAHGHRGRYGTTTALASSTSTTAESPTTVTPVGRVSPSFTTRTSARLPSIVSSVIRPCCSA